MGTVHCLVAGPLPLFVRELLIGPVAPRGPACDRAPGVGSPIVPPAHSVAQAPVP
jgi:hypothetical protein